MQLLFPICISGNGPFGPSFESLLRLILNDFENSLSLF